MYILLSININENIKNITRDYFKFQIETLVKSMFYNSLYSTD